MLTIPWTWTSLTQKAPMWKPTGISQWKPQKKAPWTSSTVHVHPLLHTHFCMRDTLYNVALVTKGNARIGFGLFCNLQESVWKRFLSPLMGILHRNSSPSKALTSHFEQNSSLSKALTLHCEQNLWIHLCTNVQKLPQIVLRQMFLFGVTVAKCSL